MLYLPDVRVITIEHPPARWLLPAATQLMLRWFGNMLRTSTPAIALGPKKVGFTWWCLIDQRLSMWAPLIGPTVALLFVLGKSPAFLYTYVLWVGTTRLLQTLLLLTARPRISGLYPPLIYFGQVYGALVKTYITFRLDRQRWTRQNIATGLPLAPARARLQGLASTYLHLLALGALVAAVAFAIDFLSLPPFAFAQGSLYGAGMQPQIVHESEVHRQHVRLKIPIQAEVDGIRYQVDDWSVGGFGVESVMTSRQPGERFPVKLIFMFEDFDMTMRFDARMVYADQDHGRFGCAFLGLSQQQMEVFRYLVDAYLSGEVVSAGDILQLRARQHRDGPPAGGLQPLWRERAADSAAAALRHQ